MQEIMNDDRFKDIQLKVSLGGSNANGGVIAHDLHGDHGDRLALGGIDFAGHDRGTRLILRERKLTQTTTWTRAQPA